MIKIEMNSNPRDLNVDPKLLNTYNVLHNASMPHRVMHGNGIVEQGQLPMVEVELSFTLPGTKETFTIIGHVIEHKEVI